MRIREGDVVRIGAGPVLKVVDIFNGMCRLLWVDQHGRIRQSFANLRDLTPFALTIGPRTLWPEVTDLPDEPEAPPANKTVRRRRSTKPKVKSKKIRKAA